MSKNDDNILLIDDREFRTPLYGEDDESEPDDDEPEPDEPEPDEEPVHLGGAGSGNFGHAGRPGEVGGSGEGGGSKKSDASLSDDIDAAESSADIRGALDKAGATPLKTGGETFPGVFVTDEYVVEWDGEDTYASVSSKDDFVNQADVQEYFPDYEDKLNEDFWDSGGEVYHATTEENAESIEREGINAESQTRGMSNRGEGPAVYTTTDIETTEMEHYGTEVFAIDVAAMKADGYTPYTAQEPDIVEGELRGALANAVGLDNYEYDYEHGMDPTTIAIFGSIPAKYVKRAFGKNLSERFDAAQSRLRVRRLYLLGGAGSGNFGHSGRPGEVGGSGPGEGAGDKLEVGFTVKAKVPYTGGGPERQKLEALRQAAKDVGDAEWEARDAHVTLASALEQKYPKDTPWTDYADEDFKAFLESREKAIETGRALEDVKEQKRAQEPLARKEWLNEHVQIVADRMDHDASKIDVVDIDPRPFEVAGRQLHEGGHFNPSTGRIEVNARNNDVETPWVQGLIAHEIMHAQDYAVTKAQEGEHEAIHRSINENVVVKEGVVKSSAFDRLFGRNGYPRPNKMAEVEHMFPASATMAKHHPNGDSYLGTWSKDANGKWAMNESELGGKRRERMEKENGFTAYSKLYWEAYKTAQADPTGVNIYHTYRRAVEETLAEVAAYQDRAARGPWGQGTPSRSWQAFAESLRETYPKTKKAEKKT